MAITINADTSNGLVMTPDTSGQIKLQAGGADIATVSSTGITMAAGKTLPASALTGSLPAIDGSNLTGLGASFKGFEVYRNAAFQLNNNVWIRLPFDTLSFKTSDITFNSSLGRITPTVAGYYLFNCFFTANNNANQRLALYKNGSAFRYAHDVGANAYTGAHHTVIAYANGTTDYFEYYHFTPLTVQLTTGVSYNYFQGQYLGA